MSLPTGPRPEIGTDEEILRGADVPRIIGETSGRFRGWLARQTESSVAILAGATVILVWLIWAVAVMSRASPDSRQIAEDGQFGDTFGAINALFTGIALVGLAYTAAMQRRELSQQEKDANGNREAIKRQAREQYLTARLNATTALQAAYQVELALEPSPYEDRRILAHDASRRLRQRIAILLYESRMGFESDWTPQIEAEAAWRYISNLLTTEANNIEEANKSDFVPALPGPVAVSSSLELIIRELTMILSDTLTERSNTRSELESLLNTINNEYKSFRIKDSNSSIPGIIGILRFGADPFFHRA